MKRESSTDPRTADVDCPRCGYRPVTILVPSTRGVYCQCDACGHMWQQADYRFPSSSAGQAPLRRRADRRASLCRYCHREASEGHRCAAADLQRRIAELESENADLRHSSRTFGDLAERLNQLLRARSRSRH